jgi:hypothetical protein
MNIDDILKLVNAGFTADQIAKMATEDTTPSSVTPQSDDKNPIPQEKAQEPKPEPAPEPEEKKEESKTEPDPELKKELEEAKAQIAKLQGIISNQNAGGSARPDTPEEYLKKIFQDMY